MQVDQNSYRKLLAGTQNTLVERLVFALLRFAAFFYGRAIRLRNWCYDQHIFAVRRAPRPVVSVGNITAGGTGKTPLVIWLCNYLSTNGLRPAILTRGYKSGSETLSDEPAMLSAACPTAKVVVNSDRLAGARTAVARFSADILIMDDGFQHRRLVRDLDIVTIDATCPFGLGRLLPAGLLREPLDSLRRAQAVIITRCDLITDETAATLERLLRNINPDLAVARAVHKPTAVIFANNRKSAIEDIKGRVVYAFCGIGNPDAFISQLSSMGITVVGSSIFNDHHQYTADDVADVFEEAAYLNANLVLTTQKDWMKMATLTEEQNIDCAYLAVALEFLAGADTIAGLLSGLCRPGKAVH